MREAAAELQPLQLERGGRGSFLFFFIFMKMPTPTESKDIPREGAEGASDASVDCSLILVKVSLPWVMAFLEILHLNLFNCTSLCFCDAPGPTCVCRESQKL